jgi:hypothetical protein
MSPPRRRRRRRSRGDQPEAASSKQTESQPVEGSRDGGPRSRSRGRRRGRGGSQRQPASPLSSEDLVRAAPKERPATLTGPPDGQTLEKLIGDLQSEWGVPQYPQEYRITIKVADERDSRPERSPVTPEPRREASDGGSQTSPKREKAPAAPRVVSSGTVEREAAPKRRRGRRRRRRGSEQGRPPESPDNSTSPHADGTPGVSQEDTAPEG